MIKLFRLHLLKRRMVRSRREQGFAWAKTNMRLTRDDISWLDKELKRQ